MERMKRMKIRYDFDVMTDDELKEWKYIAIELQDKKYLEKIKKEMNRRICHA